MNNKQSSSAGLVLGSVFTIMGFAYSNSGVWMLGLILLALGLYLKFKKPADSK
ncbi:MAG: hypothetical protein V3W18_04975 [candidate division Zixibacteria bacterium]